MQLSLVSALSKLRISIPADLRPLEARQSILLAVQELGSRFPQGLPKLNPVKVVWQNMTYRQHFPFQTKQEEPNDLANSI